MTKDFISIMKSLIVSRRTWNEGMSFYHENLRFDLKMYNSRQPQDLKTTTVLWENFEHLEAAHFFK